jgi:hypothetical protein
MCNGIGPQCFRGSHDSVNLRGAFFLYLTKYIHFFFVNLLILRGMGSGNPEFIKSDQKLFPLKIEFEFYRTIRPREITFI